MNNFLNMALPQGLARVREDFRASLLESSYSNRSVKTKTITNERKEQ